MDAAAAQRALQAAQQALQRGQLAEAKAFLAPVRKAMPREKAVLYLASRLARAEGDARGAVKLLEKALRLSRARRRYGPNMPARWMMRGVPTRR